MLLHFAPTAAQDGETLIPRERVPPFSVQRTIMRCGATHNFYPNCPPMREQASLDRHRWLLVCARRRGWFREEASWLCIPRRRRARVWSPPTRTLAHNAARGSWLRTGRNISANAACVTRGHATLAATSSRLRSISRRRHNARQA